MPRSHLSTALVLSLALPVCALAQDVVVGAPQAVSYQDKADNADVAALPNAGVPRLSSEATASPGERSPSAVGIGDSPAFVHNAPRRVPPFPLVLNQSVRDYIDAFLDQPAGLQVSFDRAAPYMPDMVRELESRGLPKDLVYLALAESGFSKYGAGPWQLSRATGRRYGLRIDRWVDERRDPVKSTQAAAEYLADLHDEIGDWQLTLVSWNRGEASMDRFWALRGKDYSRVVNRMPRPTRGLMNRFMAVAIIARNAESYGFDSIEYSRPPFERISVRGGTTLRQVAAMSGTSVETIQKLNPAILRDRVPPDVSSYEVWVPRVPDNDTVSDSSGG